MAVGVRHEKSVRLTLVGRLARTGSCLGGSVLAWRVALRFR